MEKLRNAWLTALAVLMMVAAEAHAADADPLQDFCVAKNDTGIFINGVPCKNPSDVTAADFKTSALAKAARPSPRFGSVVTVTSTTNLPGVNTFGLALARIDFAEGGVVAPHSHPRAAEVVFVLEGGPLIVGFIATNNTLFQQTLGVGDIFVFPRGLNHFLLNVGDGPAATISALNSQNPGTSLLPLALFGVSPAIPNDVLEKSFKLDAPEIARLRKVFSGS